MTINTGRDDDAAALEDDTRNAAEADGAASTGTRATDDPGGPSPDAQEGAEGDDDRGGNSEAAKWRRKFRDTEAERDQAQTHLAAQRNAVLAAAASAKRVAPALVEKTIDVDKLLDDNGILTPARAAEAIDELIREYGLPDTRPDGSAGASRTGNPTQTRSSWSDVIGGNVRTSR